MKAPALSRAIVVAALMSAVAAASVLAIPTAKLSETRPSFDLKTSVPASFDDWREDTSVVPLPPSPDQQSVLNEIYDQILSRTYVNPAGQRIMLSITYGSRQNQQMRAHRQEVCYSAQGFRISQLARMNFQVGNVTVPGTRMVATQGQRIEPVTYWFTMGDTVVLSYWDREIEQLKFSLSGYVPDGYLVRISSLDGDAKEAFAAQLSFATELMGHIDKDLRRRLIGS